MVKILKRCTVQISVHEEDVYPEEQPGRSDLLLKEAEAKKVLCGSQPVNL